MTEKGVKAIYAFMGIVSAGCFYILLDPKLPTERLRSVLDTLQAEVLLTDPAYDKPRERLEFDGKVIMMEEALQTQEDAEYLRMYENRAGMWIRSTQSSLPVPLVCPKV